MIDWAWRYGSTRAAPTGVCQLSPPDAIERAMRRAEAGRSIGRPRHVRRCAGRRRCSASPPETRGLTPRPVVTRRFDGVPLTSCSPNRWWVGARHSSDLRSRRHPWWRARRSSVRRRRRRFLGMGRSPAGVRDFHAPAGRPPAQIDRNGVSSCQTDASTIRPGDGEVAPHPFGLVLSPTARPSRRRTRGRSRSPSRSYGRRRPPARAPDPAGSGQRLRRHRCAVHGPGLSGDGRRSTSPGQRRNILVLDPATGTRQRTIDLQRGFGGRTARRLTSATRLSPDGRTAVGARTGDFRLVGVTRARHGTSVLPTALPVRPTLSSDGSRAYVANVACTRTRSSTAATRAPGDDGAAFRPSGKHHGGPRRHHGVSASTSRPRRPQRRALVLAVDARPALPATGSARSRPGRSSARRSPAYGGRGSSPKLGDDRRPARLASRTRVGPVAVVDASGQRLVATIPLKLSDASASSAATCPSAWRLSPDGRRLYSPSPASRGRGHRTPGAAACSGTSPSAGFPRRSRCPRRGASLRRTPVAPECRRAYDVARTYVASAA